MTTERSTRRIILARRPVGALQASDLALETVPVDPMPSGGVRLQTLFLSLDPFLRLFFSERIFGGTAGLPIGAMVPGAAVSRIVGSDHATLKIGDLVEGRTGWCEDAVLDGKALRKVDPALVRPSLALGAVGLPGITAYTGLLGAGGLKAGETVIISSAAGAVGTVAGQIAALIGARAIGIAGGPDKCDRACASGFAECFDYRAPDLREKLVAACPGGADLYFDNVGGDITLAACAALRRRGRMVLSGLLSTYQKIAPSSDDRLTAFLGLIMTKTLSVRSFTAIEDATDETYADLTKWAVSDKLKLTETIIDGIEHAPQAMVDMLAGRFAGKVLINVGA